MNLPMMPFDAEKIKIRPIYQSQELENYIDLPVPSQKIKHIYGDELRFPENREDRPYLFSSFVSSIDGKLAYADKPSAFYVAGKNQMAGAGKDTDFWILNALRGACDAALIGGNSMGTDPDYSMHCMDADIEEDRIRAGLPKVPLNIIMTLDATDVPLDHTLLRNEKVPAIMITSPAGMKHVRSAYKGDIAAISGQEPVIRIREKIQGTAPGILPILVTGSGAFPDTAETMRILKGIGINRLLIESPGYGNYLVKQKMMDEFFLNISGVYIGGGDTMTLGKADKGFSAEAHPHTKLLSIHIFNEYFTYFRYKFNYEFI